MSVHKYNLDLQLNILSTRNNKGKGVCLYIWVRGPNKSYLCGKATGDFPFCVTCRKRQSILQIYSEDV